VIKRCVGCNRILAVDKSHVARRNNDPGWLTDHCPECNRVHLESQQRSSGLGDGMNRVAADLFGAMQGIELLHQRTGVEHIQDAHRSLEMAAREFLGYDTKRSRRSQRKKAAAIRDEDQLLDLQDESMLRRDLLKRVREVPGLTFTDVSLLIRFYDTCAQYPAKYLEYVRLQRDRAENLSHDSAYRRGQTTTNIINEAYETLVRHAASFMRWFHDNSKVAAEQELTRV
jgi:hypothetical protein